MRVADVQLSFPAILIALLIDGVARACCRAMRIRASRCSC
jgi:ABC-type dipeptide/oligopeptide/nickel transport system permease subunit